MCNAFPYYSRICVCEPVSVLMELGNVQKLSEDINFWRIGTSPGRDRGNKRNCIDFSRKWKYMIQGWYMFEGHTDCKQFQGTFWRAPVGCHSRISSLSLHWFYILASVCRKLGEWWTQMQETKDIVQSF